MAQATLGIHAPDDEAPDEASADRPSTGRRRWLAPAVLVLCSVAIWFAPSFLARTSLRHRLIHIAMPEYPGDARVGFASLGWTSPIVLHDVLVTDPAGEELLRIEKLETSLPLATVALGSNDDLGELALTAPQLQVRLRSDGSNFEDALQPLLEQSGSSSGMTVRIERGSVRWTGTGGEPTTSQADEIDATVVWLPDSAWPSRIDCSGKISDGERFSPFSVRGGSSKDETIPECHEFALATSDLPLLCFKPVLERFGVAHEVAGIATADLLLSASPIATDQWKISGRLEGSRLRTTLPAGKRLLLERASLTGVAAWNNGELILDGANCSTDLGTANATGRFPVDRLHSIVGTKQLAHAILANDAHVSLKVDLASLPVALPDVRLREPVRSGTVDVSLRSSGEGGARRATFDAKISDVVGETFRWSQPVTACVVLRSDQSGLTAEEIRASADFLSIRGSASTSAADIRVEADLDKLRQRLAEVIDLPESILAGQLSGQVTATQSLDKSMFEFDAQGAVNDLRIATRSLEWTERELTLAVSGAIGFDGTIPRIIESGQVSLRGAGGDALSMVLRDPMSFEHRDRWSVSVSAAGDALRWLERARAWSIVSSDSNWSAEGVLDAQALLRSERDGIRVTDGSLNLQQARVQVGDRLFEEQRIQLTGDATWHRATNVLGVPNAELTSDTAVITAKALQVPLSGEMPQAGQISFRCGIGRAIRYVLPQRPSFWLSGVANGTIAFRPGGTATIAESEIELENPVLTRVVTSTRGGTEWQPLWSDERVQATLVLAYPQGDRLELQRFRIIGNGVTVEGSGWLDRLSGPVDVQLDGNWTYDLDALRQLFAESLPDECEIQGRGQSPFRIRGPLDSPTIETGIEWERVAMWGVAIGPGNLSGALDQQAIQFSPFDWPLSGGRLRGDVTIPLSPTPVLICQPGRVVDDTQLTPDMVQQWMRFATPVLADATKVQGRLSLDVTTCAVPLLNPRGAHAEGRLDIHGIDATPGDFTRTLIDLVGKTQTVLGHKPTRGSDLECGIPSQKVELKVADGRVIHDRMLVHLGDEDGLTITTSGSVGFDESLDLFVDVPLQSKWFRDERLAKSLGGQVLRIPLRGTLSRPAPDPRALQELARQVAVGAAKGVLEREVEEQVGDPLRGLFDRVRNR